MVGRAAVSEVSAALRAGLIGLTVTSATKRQ